MFIDGLTSDYSVIDLGNFKIAVSAVCSEQIYKDIYFSHSVLYYVVSGWVNLGDSRGAILKAGDIALIKQHSTVDINKHNDPVTGAPFKAILFQLYPDFIEEYLTNRRVDIKDARIDIDGDKSVFNISNNIMLKSFGNSLIPLFSRPSDLDKDMLRYKTIEALNYLVEYNPNLITVLFSYTKPHKIDLYDFMHENYITNDSIEQLSKLSGRSVSTFKREFKDIFNTTPHRWILDQKLTKSAQLLKSGLKSPSDLYVIFGFNSLAHFSISFKKRFGCSPSNYI